MSMSKNTQEQELSPRQIALRDFLTSYQGRACSKCGSTTRYTKSSACVPCMKIRVRNQRIEWARAKNAADAQRSVEAARLLLEEVTKV